MPVFCHWPTTTRQPPASQPSIGFICTLIDPLQLVSVWECLLPLYFTGGIQTASVANVAAPPMQHVLSELCWGDVHRCLCMGTSDGLVVIAQWQSNSQLKLGLIPISCTCTYTHLLFSFCFLTRDLIIDAFTNYMEENFNKMQIISKTITWSSCHAPWWERKCGPVQVREIICLPQKQWSWSLSWEVFSAR